MFCPKCGKEIPEGSTVCPECNATLEVASTTAQTSATAEKKPAPVGFILGLVSIIAWFIPLFGYPVTICGIVFSAKQLKSTDSGAKTMAIVGLVLSIIFLVVTLINSALGVLIQLSTQIGRAHV